MWPWRPRWRSAKRCGRPEKWAHRAPRCDRDVPRRSDDLPPRVQFLPSPLAGEGKTADAVRPKTNRDVKEGRSVSYAVKEIFMTLQGEGAHAGRAAVFCRFSGCNLWSGREQDRASATCQFCDTDFVGIDGTLGGRYDSAEALADTIAGQWTGAGAN